MRVNLELMVSLMDMEDMLMNQVNLPESGTKVCHLVMVGTN